MTDVHSFSDRVIDLAERLQDVADAAEGKGNRRSGGPGARWLLLPAAGAGVYALATSNGVGRRAKGAIEQAKTRASELPDDLMNRVRQTSQSRSNGSTGQGQSRGTSSSRRSGSTTRKRRSTRKSTSAR